MVWNLKPLRDVFFVVLVGGLSFFMRGDKDVQLVPRQPDLCAKEVQAKLPSIIVRSAYFHQFTAHCQSSFVSFGVQPIA